MNALAIEDTTAHQEVDMAPGDISLPLPVRYIPDADGGMTVVCVPLEELTSDEQIAYGNALSLHVAKVVAAAMGELDKLAALDRSRGFGPVPGVGRFIEVAS